MRKGARQAFKNTAPTSPVCLPALRRGGQWTSEGASDSADAESDSANDGGDAAGDATVDGADQFNSPGIQVAASGGLSCDGFPSGCQSGGSYGMSGMYYINGRVLCMDCAVKYFGLQDEPASERLRFLEPFLIGK